jgi:hypothetical protein
MTTRLAHKPMEQLIRKRIGEIPILQTVIQRLRLREILLSYIKPHGNETVPAVDTLLVLVWNIACGRQPLYELSEWVAKLDSGLLGHVADASEDLYGDDRFARALDKLYAADRASMVTDIALRVIETTGVDLSELHNDSTTVKSCGHMPGKTATGLYFTQGHPISSRLSTTSRSAPMGRSPFTIRPIPAIAPTTPCTLRSGMPCARLPVRTISCMWPTARSALRNSCRISCATVGAW